ncbi:MAG: pentapeptide repeat-containing protein [Pseudomonadota bacterium]
MVDDEDVLKTDLDEHLREGIPLLGKRSGPGLEVGFLMLILGLAIGTVFSTFGLELFAKNAPAIFSTLLALVIFLVAIFVLLVLLRRQIWSRVFQRTEIEIERMAQPLSEVARHAAEKDVPKTTDAARNLAELALARYAWLSTRRWLIASLTGLIAAIAALAGSALLFHQNELLEKQGESLNKQTALLEAQTQTIVTQTNLLQEQNQSIDTQIGLLQTDAQLKDSDRSANILPNIVTAAAKLGDEVTKLKEAGKVGDDENYKLEDISLSLRNQFITITNTVRPYRYLKSDVANQYTTREMRDFAMRRREDLPKTLEFFGVKPEENTFALIDFPLSPERGAIISALFNFRILETELLSFFGADFSYAEVSTPNLFKMTFRHANLRFSEFRNMEIRAVNFGAAGLENARFIDSYLTSVNFRGHMSNEAPGLYKSPGEPFFMPTQTSGIEFSNSLIYNCDFSDIEGFAQNFDDSLIVQTSFAGADLGAATFRNTVLHEVDFSDTLLASVDFEGAIVFEANFLDKLKDNARPGTFAPDRYELEPVPPTGLQGIDLLEQFGVRVTTTSIDGLKAFRVKRVKPFEQ